MTRSFPYREVLHGVTGDRLDAKKGTLSLLSDGVRASRFVNFQTGVLTQVSPMELTKLLRDDSSIIEKVQVFECRMEVWYLGPAMQILRMIETHNESSIWGHAGFSLVTIIANYFEAIGKILNDKSNAWRTGEEDFAYGFKDVYHSPSELMIETVRDRMRNGTYHLVFPKGGFWITHDPNGRDGDFSLCQASETSPIECVMDPHRVACSIVDHFDGFIKNLHTVASNPSQNLTVNFLRFFNELPYKFAEKKQKNQNTQ